MDMKDVREFEDVEDQRRQWKGKADLGCRPEKTMEVDERLFNFKTSLVNLRVLREWVESG